MVSTSSNYGVLNDDKQLFVGCLAVVLVLSGILFLLCRWRRWAAVVAAVFTFAWVLLLLPDTQYYLDTRDATRDSIAEPFHRQNEAFGYVLVFIPVPVVLLGLYLRRQQSGARD
jgi:uncharacterized membrane protein YphA (DoxX/SURF4 family)